MSLATDLKAIAEELIDDPEFSTVATLTQMSTRSKTGRASEPTYGAPDTTPINVVDYDQTRQDGTNVRKMLVSTSAGVTPLKGDTVTIGTETVEIDKVKPITLAGLTLTFELELMD